MGQREGPLEVLEMTVMQEAGFWNDKRVLITGHTGFKGGWLSLWLTSLGAKVKGFALRPQTAPSFFDAADVGTAVESEFGDLRELPALVRVFERFEPELVFHMAAQALVLPSYADPVGTFATNVMGTVHVLEAARRSDSTRVVLNVTSDKCYENREWEWGYRENEPMGGADPYSSSKGCSELVTTAFRRSFYSSRTPRVGLASARAGNVIGGGDWAPHRLVPDCVRALSEGRAVAVRSPHSVRPWQHVLEPLRGYMLLAERLWNDPASFSQGWNFGPDASQAKPVRYVVDRVVERWGPDARWECLVSEDGPHEAHHLSLDCSLARSRLGWTPRLGLDSTLEWTVDWYRRFHGGESAKALAMEQIVRYQSLERRID